MKGLTASFPYASIKIIMEGFPKEQNPEDNKENVPLRNYMIPSQEQWDKVKKFFDEYLLIPLTLEQEAELRAYFEGKEERDRKVAKGLTEVGVHVLLGAGLLGWTTGQVLKYSLLGWTLDANGMPRKDAAALKTFEDAYKATKDGSVIGGITKGLGIAA